MLVRTRRGVLEYLQCAGTYSRQQVDRVTAFLAGRAGVGSGFDLLPSPLRENLANSKYFRCNPRAISLTRGVQAKDCQPDPSLPPGWGSTPGSGLFLSPEGVLIRTAFGVFEYIKCSERVVGEEIKQVAAYLKRRCNKGL
jgi:hypothetical protein